MIPKRINRAPENDNYRALALYVADAALGKVREKTLFSWYSGGITDTDDYWPGLEDVELVQAMNQRSKVSKTYHLMVSFRPEDEDKLTREVLRDIENTLMKALGFDEHQRHCGVHQNTDNLHLHIAINMIHPQTYNRHAPYRDHYKLSRACRAIEQKYGLTVDKGAEPDAPKMEGRANSKVKTIEAQTGQESLFNYVLRHKPDLMEKLESAESWLDVHAAFLQFGLTLVPSGNSLKIRDRYGKHHVKPSDIDRQLGKGLLVKCFGPFVEAAPGVIKGITAVEKYSGAPLQLEPERDNLYAIFKDEMEHRQQALSDVKLESRRLYDACKDKWAKKRQTIKKIPLLRHDRQRLQDEIKRREQTELDQLRAATTQKRNVIRAEIPYTTWSKCLQHKAAQGNETALSILRSKKELIIPELQTSQPSQASDHLVHAVDEQRKKIKDSHGISNKHSRSLLSVLKMREVMEHAGLTGEDLTFSVDGKGIIIYTLPGGGRIRDLGKEIHFSPKSQQARALAIKYAGARWGQHWVVPQGPIICSGVIKHQRIKGVEKNGYNMNR